ncbi:DNA repair protein Rev1 isoform X2 [Anabrus simplex]|uniref:DNA repair protein Rev1 isoform X2 n=1 Tax=Anabrus simplex TaxID=316456 RepID=UPI0035A28845
MFLLFGCIYMFEISYHKASASLANIRKIAFCTLPSADELKKIMMHHGGVYHHYETSLTTHIIASNLPDCKVKRLNLQKIVRPEWITDSLKAGHLQDYHQYLLYSNRQPQLNFGPSTSKSAANPSFISEFYGKSRLHHLSTMGAMFKQYVSELREKNFSSDFPGCRSLIQWKKTKQKSVVRDTEDDLLSDVGGGKVIMHIDMDCFFVSVGLRTRPELRGKPVAVTHAKGNPRQPRTDPAVIQKEIDCYKEKHKNDSEEVSHWYDELDAKSSMSEIASCNYEARKFGLKNGMFLGAALKMCPNLKTIPYDFEAYKQVSYTLYDTVASFTLDIEAVSCDEMYVDCTTVLKDTRASPLEFAAFLRQQIKSKTGCPCSAGLGSNPLQARLATRKAKPDGQFYLQPAAVKDFMLTISVEDLPGVGYSLSSRLHSQGVSSCGELQNLPLNQLKKQFGAKTGEMLYKHSRGLDERTLAVSHQRKSVSAEINYGIRFTEQTQADTFLQQLATEVESRLNSIGMRGQCVTLKLMVRAKNAGKETAKYMGHGVCDHITRSSTLPSATSDASIIAREVLALEHQLNVTPSDLRGMGIQVSRLQAATKRDRHVSANRQQDKPGILQERRENDSSYMKEPLMSVAQARDIIHAWVNSEYEPKQCDVTLIAQYFQQLAASRRLSALGTLLRQFSRSLSRQSHSTWQAAFNTIMSKAQQAVQLVYGHQLKMCSELPQHH